MTIIGYLDPGTGTLIVQAVLGGAAGAAVLLKTKGRRLFKKSRADATDQDQVETKPGEVSVPNVSSD